MSGLAPPPLPPLPQVPGRTFPVDVVHALEDHTGEYSAAAVDTAIDIHCNQPEGEAGCPPCQGERGGQGEWEERCCADGLVCVCANATFPLLIAPAPHACLCPCMLAGDILMFLTGQAEIDKAVKQLNDAGGWGSQSPSHAVPHLPWLQSQHRRLPLILSVCSAAPVVPCHAVGCCACAAAVRSLPAEACGDLLVLPIYAALPPDMQVGGWAALGAANLVVFDCRGRWCVRKNPGGSVIPCDPRVSSPRCAGPSVCAGAARLPPLHRCHQHRRDIGDRCGR